VHQDSLSVQELVLPVLLEQLLVPQPQSLLPVPPDTSYHQEFVPLVELELQLVPQLPLLLVVVQDIP
jgi:hypothetical protein